MRQGQAPITDLNMSSPDTSTSSLRHWQETKVNPQPWSQCKLPEVTLAPTPGAPAPALALAHRGWGLGDEQAHHRVTWPPQACTNPALVSA